MPLTYPRWDDPSLQVSSDSSRRARYRLLQSWFRETELGVPPGTKKGKPGLGRQCEVAIGSMLSPEHGSKGLNFLRPEVVEYAQVRAREVKKKGGTLESVRLERNMFSSMPLCFNLFGWLRFHRAEAAAALGEVLALDIARVTEIEVEWAPPPDQHLGDRSAFDAYVEYVTSAGEPGFLGVETKYTEPFSRFKYIKQTYRTVTEAEDSGFVEGAVDRLVKSSTNQVWRNALLAISLRRSRGLRLGHSVVLACAGDPGAKAAVAGLSDCHREPASVLRAGTLESLVDALSRLPEAAEFATDFRRRYLNTSPVLGAAVLARA